jgi:rubrerythrin
MFSAREIIDMAIKIERNGENYYRQATVKVTDPSLQSLLLFLADEEHEHARWFEALKQRIKDSDEDRKLAEISGTMLQSVVGNQRFSLDEADLAELDSTEKLIGIAIEFEKDSILFYEMLQSFIEDSETLRQLNEIIAEENRHIEMLNDYRRPH